MKYKQRDIVEVSFLFPDGTFKPHPAIIVSNDELQENEDGTMYLVLITSNDTMYLVLITSNDTINPQYSYIVYAYIAVSGVSYCYRHTTTECMKLLTHHGLLYSKNLVTSTMTGVE